MERTQKTASRLEYLLDENYRRLDTSSKKLMDALKLLSPH
jgi:hypothetical protein